MVGSQPEQAGGDRLKTGNPEKKMFAVIETGGKQYKVEKDDTIQVERLEAEPGKNVSFPNILAIGEGSEITSGSPLIKDAKVEGKVLEHLRGPKLTVFKMKRRKGYRKKHGHRQELTRVQISKIARKK